MDIFNKKKVARLTEECYKLQNKIVKIHKDLTAAESNQDCLTHDLIMMDHELSLVAYGRYINKYVKFVDEIGCTYMCKVTDAVSDRGIIRFHTKEVVTVGYSGEISLAKMPENGVAFSTTLSNFKSNGSIIKAAEYHALANRCTEPA